jgi:hypothetical protein
MHISEPLLPELSPFKFEITTEKPKRYKSPGTDEIPAELINAGGNTKAYPKVSRLDNEIHTYLWYYSLRSNTKGYGCKTH